MKLLERAWTVYQSNGTAEVLKRIRFQIFKYDPYDVYELSLDNDLKPVPSNLVKLMEQLKKRYELEWLTGESMENLQSYLTYRQDLSEQEVIRWLHDGHATLMARHRGKIIGDSWLALGSFPVSDSDMVIDLVIDDMIKQRGYAYSFSAYVVPQYRGQGIFPLLLNELMEIALQKGKKALLGTVSLSNTPSKKTLEALGFKPIGRQYIFYIIGKKYKKTKLMEVQLVE